MAKKLDNFILNVIRDSGGEVVVYMDYHVSSDEYPEQKKRGEITFKPKDRPLPTKSAWSTIKDDIIDQIKAVEGM